LIEINKKPHHLISPYQETAALPHERHLEIPERVLAVQKGQDLRERSVKGLPLRH
jgi:hypothetical protein